MSSISFSISNKQEIFSFFFGNHFFPMDNPTRVLIGGNGNFKGIQTDYGESYRRTV